MTVPLAAQEKAPPQQEKPMAPPGQPAQPAQPAPPETSPVVTLGKTQLTVSGYFRPRATATFNYEIDSSALSDETRSFIDARSYLTLEAKHGPIIGVFSLDIAGDDFTDGDKWGYPGNPGFQAEWTLGTRLAYVQWNTKHVNFLFGRIPARLGNGFVANVNRDAGRFVIKTGIGNFIGTAVKGADDKTVPGTEGGLNAYILLYASKPYKKDKKQVSGQLWIGKQDPEDRPGKPSYPAKFILGGAIDPKFDKLALKAEATYLGGNSGGAKLIDNKGGMLWLDSDYQFTQKVSAGAMFGYGTGDNDPLDDEQNNFQSYFLDENAAAYTNVYADDLHGFRGAFPGSVNFGSGFANTTFFQAHLKAMPGKKAEITASYTYLHATKAQKIGSGPIGARATTATGTTQSIGSEIDANVSYKIAPVATLWLRTGILFMGEIWGADVDDTGKIEAFLELKF
jgi:hypothetical protein